MNHIARLQTDLAAAQSEIAAKTAVAQDFRLHLLGDKFNGTDPDGSRRDWIAVADVQAWISRLLAAGT